MAQAAVTIGLLGPVAVDDGSGMTDVPGVRARRLLAALALELHAVRSVPVLIDLIWGDDPPRSPQAALHTQISRLRQVLGDKAIAGVSAGYRLQPGHVTTDIECARALIDTPTSDALATASRLWRGVPGDDLGGGRLAEEMRSTGDDLRRRLDDRRARAALEADDPETARQVAQSLCDADPLDEPAHITLMRALSAAGRPGDALAVYSRLRRTLSTELGVDPGVQAQALHRELLRAHDEHAPVEPATVVAERPFAPAVGLRAEPNPLLGRHADVDGIVAALDGDRVITVTGPGGSGKTRVAQAVASRCHQDGRAVYFVELASVRSDDDVVAAVSSAIGVSEMEISPTNRTWLPTGDLTGRLADALSVRSAVLVLDNCEQVIDGAARLVAHLIAAVAGLRVLATSRAPLMIAGEAVRRLDPLPVDESGETASPAVDLFVARAVAVRPDVVIDRAVVTQLCRDLDGLPLAIELAAARVRTMAVGEISELLARRLRSGRLSVLRSGDRTAPHRHRTLQSVIEWSWELLEDDSRLVLRRMCLFPSGFSGDAARRVVESVGAQTTSMSVTRTDDALEALVNQSLLGVAEIDGNTRYRMLEMVREFGEEKLTAAGEDDAVVAAMTRWAAGYVRDVRAAYEAGEQTSTLAVVNHESGNLVWILRRCTDPNTASRPPDHRAAVAAIFAVVAGSLVIRGKHAEVRTLGQRVISELARPPAGLDEQTREYWLASLLVAVAHIRMLSPQPRIIARAMIDIRALYDPDAVMRTRIDFVSAIMVVRHGLSGLRVISRGCRSHDVKVRVVALTMRSHIWENAGNIDMALRDSLEAERLAVRDGDHWVIAMGSTEIGGIYGQSGRYDEAVQRYQIAMDNLRSIGAHEETTQVHCYLIGGLLAGGQIDRAREEFSVVSDGWLPDDPIPPGATETVSLIVLLRAEIASVDGDLELSVRVASRALRYVLTEYDRAISDPSALMTVGSGTALIATAGAPTQAQEFVAPLAEMVRHQLVPGGFRDYPQIGAAAVAVGAVTSLRDVGSLDGARLMAMGARIGARRDHPVIDRTIAAAQQISGMEPDEWSRIWTDVDRMSRRRAADDILSILDRVG